MRSLASRVGKSALQLTSRKIGKPCPRINLSSLSDRQPPFASDIYVVEREVEPSITAPRPSIDRIGHHVNETDRLVNRVPLVLSVSHPIERSRRFRP